MIKQISDAEWELMKIIWNNGGTALYNQIMNSLEAKNKTWQKNTVITLLSRLVNKGLLQTNKIGHRNEYIAIVSEGDYQAFQTKTLVNKFYEGSAKGLVSTLIQKDMLSSDDYNDLKKFWEDGNNKE